MTNYSKALTNLHRPRLLVRAARFGLADYVRERDLKRIMRTSSMPSPRTAVARLMATEADLEETRLAGEASYSASRHVDVMIALMAEVSLLPAAADKA